jgi:RNA polymerase subunit RPABC4/transcription elongation factor Spt4
MHNDSTKKKQKSTATKSSRGAHESYQAALERRNTGFGHGDLFWDHCAWAGSAAAFVVYGRNYSNSHDTKSYHSFMVRSVSLTPEAALQHANCPNCQKIVQTDFTICPYCRTELRVACPSCNRSLQRDWQACPYCRHEIVHLSNTSNVSALVRSPLADLPV